MAGTTYSHGLEDWMAANSRLKLDYDLTLVAERQKLLE